MPLGSKAGSKLQVMRPTGFLLLVSFILRADSSLPGPVQPAFATYLGGGGAEVVGSVTTDLQGNIYIAGRTDSQDFPVLNAIQPISKAFSQIFIAKFSPTGDLLFSTYFGGSANDLATGIAVDPAGNIYVTGTLQSLDFPVTNAFQPKSNGGTDAFVMKIDASFKVVYATYLGGTYNELAMAIAADAQGNAYVTGRTESADFPTTAGAFQTTPPGASTDVTAYPYFGHTNPNAFVTKLDPAGNLVYSTFLSGDQGSIGWAIAVDAFGQAHVAGETGSLNFPIAGNALQSTPGSRVLTGPAPADAFLSKLTADGSGLVYSTLMGGPMTDTARSVSLDANGNAYITGITSDARLPIIGGTQLYLGGDVYLVSSDGGATFQPRRTGLASAWTTALAFDPHVPSLIYAGSLQGVFRSMDGGNTWAPAGLDTYWIRSIVPDPANPGTLYAGTYFGGGIFRSTDGGDTWSSWTAGLAKAEYFDFATLAVDPTTPGTIYALSGSGGIGAGGDLPLYRVTDGGATWTGVGHGLPATPLALAFNPMDLSLLAGTPYVFIFSGPFGPPPPPILGGVYSFANGAWVQQGSTDDIHAMAVNGGTIYAAGTKFYRSTDGGATWTTTTFHDQNANTAVSQIATNPNDPSTIYLTTGGSLLRSIDGGDSFQTVSSLPLTTIAINPMDGTLHAGASASSDAYIAGFGPDGTLMYANFTGTPACERGSGVALDSSGSPYIVAVTGACPSGPPYGNFGVPYNGNAFVSSADGSYQATIGPTTNQNVLDMPAQGITIGPDGSIIAVMVATAAGLPTTPNAPQGYLRGASDVYLVKWSR